MRLKTAACSAAVLPKIKCWIFIDEFINTIFFIFNTNQQMIQTYKYYISTEQIIKAPPTTHNLKKKSKEAKSSWLKNSSLHDV